MALGVPGHRFEPCRDRSHKSRRRVQLRCRRFSHQHVCALELAESLRFSARVVSGEIALGGVRKRARLTA